MGHTVADPTPVTQAWWDATRDQRLVIQACATCGHRQHEPRTLCQACAGVDLRHLDTAGTGTVHSFTVIHRAPSPDVDAPYVVAIVELDEGVRLLTNLIDVDPAEVTCDMPVTVTWLALDDGRHLPQFRPA